MMTISWFSKTKSPSKHDRKKPHEHPAMFTVQFITVNLRWTFSTAWQSCFISHSFSQKPFRSFFSTLWCPLLHHDSQLKTLVFTKLRGTVRGGPRSFFYRIYKPICLCAWTLCLPSESPEAPTHNAKPNGHLPGFKDQTQPLRSNRQLFTGSFLSSPASQPPRPVFLVPQWLPLLSTSCGTLLVPFHTVPQSSVFRATLIIPWVPWLYIHFNVQSTQASVRANTDPELHGNEPTAPCECLMGISYIMYVWEYSPSPTSSDMWPLQGFLFQ